MEDFTIGNVINIHSVWHALTGKGGLFMDRWLLERDAVIKKLTPRGSLHVAPCDVTGESAQLGTEVRFANTRFLSGVTSLAQLLCGIAGLCHSQRFSSITV